MNNINLTRTNAYMALLKLGKKRRLILDGSMDTQIRKFKLKDRHYGGKQNRGNNNILNITQPKVIEKIHLSYLEAGADIIVTNTFNSNQITQSSYNNNYSCIELNKQAVLIAKRARLKYSFQNKRRVFVAGSVGSTNKSLTVPSNKLEPAYRDVSFDEMVTSYKQQINTLLSMNVDILLIETVYDMLNAKAALFAYSEVCSRLKIEYALVISVTISDTFGRLLSGQTLEAFWHSISHVNPLAVGLNCSVCSNNLKQYASELSNITGKPIWIYPNAGYPNDGGKHTLNADDFSKQIKTLIKHACVLGGCCGSTPKHISELAKLRLVNKPTKVVGINKQQNCLFLSGLEAIKIDRDRFYEIGEQASISGSRRFKNLITSGDYKQALDIVRQQIWHGARIIDINMDDTTLDPKVEVSKFLNLINTEPDLSALPIMIDSSEWSTLLIGIKHIQGRGIVNSISLKDGDKQFIDKAMLIKMHGCLPVVVASDERGYASTIDQRLGVCKRIHGLLTKEVGFKDEEIIIDLNTLAIATGIVDYDRDILDLIKTIKLVSTIYPKVNLVLGISNLSFTFRGNIRFRESLQCVFLRYAKLVGLNLGILNVHNKMSYNKLSKTVKDLCGSLILNNRQVSIEEISNVFGTKFNTSNDGGDGGNWRNWNVESRIVYAIVIGIDKYIEWDLVELVGDIGVLQVIEGPLKDGVNVIWKLFGNGMMVLFQIMKSVRVINKIMAFITPLMDNKRVKSSNVIVMVTAKGDVHDIETNIVGIVLSCNNYRVIDLGIMVSSDGVVQAAIKYKANVIVITGSISSSLDEMVEVARLMQRKSLDIPLLVRGKATSELYTAVKIYSEYPNGIVIHVRDVNEVVDVMVRLFEPTSGSYIKTLKSNYELIIENHNKSKLKQCEPSSETSLSHLLKHNKKLITDVNFVGTEISCIESFKHLNVNNELNGCRMAVAKATTLRKKILNKMISERWVGIRTTIDMMRADNKHGSIHILNSNNSLVDKFPTLKQQQNKKICLRLSDFVDGDNDNISTYCWVLGIEFTLIHRYFNDKNRFQCAYVFKSICDDLVESC
ncbi:Methionine synthase [Candidatus Hodgkinia cicadicola]|uniref:Methionine synthase n=1 Tax=Candidatus Hodgkinia cicadicola TaxID=573658 RepID=A0ABX4MFI1_9HYPH|nr:Methionine synthase [Candidatus Hodgkinia cicadicola]